MLLLLKSMLVVLNQVKFLNLIVLLYSLTVYLEVAHVVGLLLDIYHLPYYSSLVIFGMVLELFLETFLLVLILIQKNKLNLVLSKNQVILQQENSQFNAIVFSFKRAKFFSFLFYGSFSVYILCVAMLFSLTCLIVFKFL